MMRGPFAWIVKYPFHGLRLKILALEQWLKNYPDKLMYISLSFKNHLPFSNWRFWLLLFARVQNFILNDIHPFRKVCANELIVKSTHQFLEVHYTDTDKKVITNCTICLHLMNYVEIVGLVKLLWFSVGSTFQFWGNIFVFA